MKKRKIRNKIPEVLVTEYMRFPSTPHSLVVFKNKMFCICGDAIYRVYYKGQ